MEYSEPLASELDDNELGEYILEYFRDPPYVQKYDKRGEAGEKVVEMPTIQGVCFRLQITRSELEVRCVRSVYLLRMVELCGLREYDLLMKNGLGGVYNSAVTNLTLQSRHGFSTKAEVVEKRETALTAEDKVLLEEMGLRVVTEVIDG